MRSISRKIGASLLASIMVLASFSFKADLHYCGDHLVDIALDGKLESCGMMPLDSSEEEACDLMAMSCCSDLEISKEVQDTTPAEVVQLDFESPLFLPPLHTPGLEIPAQAIRPDFSFYKGPPRIRNLSVWNQVFLL